MATGIADIVYWIALGLIVVSQFFILRSTVRGMRIGPSGYSALLEWSYALLPVIGLAVLMVFTWRAMHPATFRVEGIAPAAGIPS